MLCIEKFSHLIVDKVDRGFWKALRIAGRGLAISHLFFADDLILFGQASLQQAETMHSYMDTFCDVSGQQVSFSKSRVFCSKNVRVGDARDIVRACGSPFTDNLGKYLGLPLLHDRVNKNTFHEILEKVQRRLAS
ncbi:hypothetical protein ACOSQ2_032446 [Xanthoceras sorbifolium]